MMQIPTEHQEQCALFEWAAWMAKRIPELHLMHAIPNGGKRDIRTAAMLKADGVKPGVPDIFLPVSRGGKHGLYIELKRRKGMCAPSAMVRRLQRTKYWPIWLCE